jgi:hypothetical protein
MDIPFPAFSDGLAQKTLGVPSIVSDSTSDIIDPVFNGSPSEYPVPPKMDIVPSVVSDSTSDIIEHRIILLVDRIAAFFSKQLPPIPDGFRNCLQLAVALADFVRLAFLATAWTGRLALQIVEFVKSRIFGAPADEAVEVPAIVAEQTGGPEKDDTDEETGHSGVVAHDGAASLSLTASIG